MTPYPHLVHYLRCRADAGATPRELLEVIERPWRWKEEIEAAWQDFRPSPLVVVVPTPAEA
jgi:hypothetical protein